MLHLARFSWPAFGGRFLVPSSQVLTSLRRLDGVCPVTRRLATAQTFLDKHWLLEVAAGVWRWGFPVLRWHVRR